MESFLTLSCCKSTQRCIHLLAREMFLDLGSLESILARTNTLDIMHTNGCITGVSQVFKRRLRLVLPGIFGDLRNAPVFEQTAKILARQVSRVISIIEITIE